jgi:hypothetical protein
MIHHKEMFMEMNGVTIMSRLRNLWLLAFLFYAPEAFAQQIGPHIAYVYPAGGRQGTTFEVNVGGQFLTSTTQVYITGNGVQAQVLDSTRPMNIKLKTLLDRVHALQTKRMRVSANLVSTESGSGKKKNLDMHITQVHTTSCM